MIVVGMDVRGRGLELWSKVVKVMVERGNVRMWVWV